MGGERKDDKTAKGFSWIMGVYWNKEIKRVGGGEEDVGSFER